MPIVKFKKNKSNAIDLNPMVDIAFQLIIFFMLTTQFKSDEPVEVIIPSATSEIKIPERDIITITVSEDSRIFFHVDGKFTRENMLNRMANRYKLNLTEKDVESFTIASSFGMPAHLLPDWIKAKPSERKLIQHTGIPCDSSRNELADWIINARMANPKVRIAIKADKKTPYPAIKKVIETLVDNNITRFNFITDSEIKS